MLSEILLPVLTLVIGYLVKKAFDFFKVELDQATYNALVGAIVAYLVALLGLEAARAAAPSLF